MKVIRWKELFFYLLQSAKFMMFKILTFHIRKNKTGFLLIRNDSLGDFLISLPLFEQIASYAHARNQSVTIVVSEDLAPFCREFPIFDTVVPLPRNGLKEFRRRIRCFRAVTRYQAEKVILFLALGRSGEHDYMAALPRSREKYALETMETWPVSPSVAAYRRLFFNRKYTSCVSYDTSVTLLKNELRLVQAALKEELEERLGDIRPLYPLPQVGALDFPYYLIVPGSACKSRQWPPEKFASLIDRLREVYPGLTPVVTGSKWDSEAVEELLRHCRGRENVVNLCGRSSLKELFRIVQEARFLVTNDTAPYHIAPLVGTKTFCIGGRWHLGAHGPAPLYKDSAFIYVEGKCKRCLEDCYEKNSVYPCLDQVTVSQVLDRIVEEIKIENRGAACLLGK